MTDPDEHALPLGSAVSVARVARVAREPWLWVIVLATVAHVVRGNVVDICVFSATAVAIIIDDRRETVRTLSLEWVPRRAVAATCVAYAAIVLPMSRGGWPLRLTLVVPGLIAAATVLHTGHSPLQDPQTAEPQPPARWWWWSAVLVVGCLLELANFLQQPDPSTDSYAHPTLSALVDPMLTTGVARAVFVGVWLAVGWWLVAVILRGKPSPR